MAGVALSDDGAAEPDPTPIPTEASIGRNGDISTPESDSGDGSNPAASTPVGFVTPGEPNLQQVASPSPEVSVSIEGTVSDAAGDPVQGAIVANGREMTITGADGLFQINPAASDATVTVLAPGYLAWAVPDGDTDTRLNVILERQQINGLYFNPNFSYNEEDIQRFIDMINSSAANAVVIDIKEEVIFYDSKVQLFVDAGIIRPVMDLGALVQRFKEEGIYTIARHVVFKDSLVAQHAPYLAVLNNQTGDLWRDFNGVAWVNPMVHDLWDANIELAVEAAGFGFDEIQYDYVRFPTDGDYNTMDFGLPNTQANREKSINSFLERSREALGPLGVRQSADVFGYTLLVDDDLGIGQNFVAVAERVDYISPMIYPSHWPEGSLNVPGHPNSFPYETIEISMMQGAAKLGDDMLKMRPWLQDFSFPNLMEYGDEEVRLQIEATEASGASGWMLWDPNNWFSPGGFSDTGGSIPGATPTAATPAAINAMDRTTKRFSIRRSLRAGTA